MSRENDFATRMSSDTPLMAILTGGVHKYSATADTGITRETTPTAFDANGWLKPCALVKQRNLITTTDVVDYVQPVQSNRQIIEVRLYQRSEYSSIDTAKARLRALFHGHQFSDSFEVKLIEINERLKDAGTLNSAPMEIMQFEISSVWTGS